VKTKISAHSWFSFLCLLTLTLEAQPYLPLSLTGFNLDAVAETTPALAATSNTLDAANAVLISSAYGAAFGTTVALPNNGSITGNGATYQLAPYNQNNCLSVPPAGSGTLNLATPVPVSSLSLLGFATNGTGSLAVTVTFTDNTIYVFPAGTISDWTTNTGFFVSERANRNTSALITGINGWLKEYRLVLPCSVQTKAVSTIVIQNTGSTSRLHFMSASYVSVQPTAFTTPTINICAINGMADLRFYVIPSGGTFSPTSFLSPAGIFTPPGTNTVLTVSYSVCGTASASLVNYVPPQATFVSTIAPLCVNSPTVQLLSYVQGTTGVFTGTGVTGSIFNPSVSGTGNFVITHATGPGTCALTSTIAVAVLSMAPAQVAGTPSLCNNQTAFQFTGSPAGGIFGGVNINANGLFSVQNAAPATYTITYSVTTGPCLSISGSTIKIVAMPVILILPTIPRCNSDPPFSLDPFVQPPPPNGSFTGGSVFFPSTAGAGNHYVKYTVNNDGCIDTDSLLIIIKECPNGLADHKGDGRFFLWIDADHVRFTLPEQCTVNIAGTDGRILHSVRAEEARIGPLEPGIYIVTVQTPFANYCRKIVVTGS
jgi:hypothetical protein